ncbi:hypothetical protein KSE_64315 [Kitasatospora setae KM-6054]|uniref:Uncharacterized protein n=1 Tax=Kitasatospora setae (strain ATCC 33774 / DSM 43861 / JCM 3304 / KCC A-0304 / NBRC 14216 / KM-6054) TaxID=452652 RepID=E4N207_KITSK|nr:hypothetical protein KSE_64315 [Kitasatospora setae KM-6054]
MASPCVWPVATQPARPEPVQVPSLSAIPLPRASFPNGGTGRAMRRQPLAAVVVAAVVVAVVRSRLSS